MNKKRIIRFVLIILLGWLSTSAYAIVITSEEFFNQVSGYSDDLQVAIADDQEIESALGSLDVLDVNSFVQRVLRESYLIQNAILNDYAQQVRDFNEAKASVRSTIQRLRGQNSSEQTLVYEAIPYLLYMGTSSDSEPTTITTDDFDDDSLNTVNVFLSSVGLGNYNFAPTTSVPESSSLILMGIGLAGLGFVRRRKRA